MQITFSYLYFQKYAVVIVLLLYNLNDLSRCYIGASAIHTRRYYMLRIVNITHFKPFVNSFFKTFLKFFNFFLNFLKLSTFC